MELDTLPQLDILPQMEAPRGGTDRLPPLGQQATGFRSSPSIPTSGFEDVLLVDLRGEQRARLRIEALGLLGDGGTTD